MKKRPSDFRKMISYYRNYQAVFWLDMFFAFVSSVISLIIPLIVRYVTGTLVNYPSEVILQQVPVLALGFLVLVIINFYCKFYISNVGHVMGARIEFDMRAEIFDHLQKLSFSFYDNQQIGRLMSRITTDLFDITELMHHGPENIILSAIKLIGAFIILFSINWKLSVAAICVLPAYGVFAVIMNTRMRKAFRENRKKIAEINGQIEDNLAGIRVVKSFANEQAENEKFRIGNVGFLNAKKNSYLNMGVFAAGMETGNFLLQVIIIVVGTLLLATGTITATDLVTFLLYIHVLIEPITTIIQFTEQFQNGFTGFERFREIMDTEADIKDKEGAVDLPAVKGDVEFKDVSFVYDGTTSKVLDKVNLTIPAGSYYALVGASGAGKTTLCSLIPRFYEVTEGSITIDGHDIRDVTMTSLRGQIGIVQQDVYLFAGTVFENILYGKPGATREEVIEAAKKANAHDFIMSLPDGYDTDIGQRGVKLSGGQKQRLSIARVFLKNPPLLIFDEATSALDNESEKVVQESLEKLAANRTTLVIAHRLSTIRNAEKIVVLTDDGIAESGTHGELIAAAGIYADLYNMQFS